MRSILSTSMPFDLGINNLMFVAAGVILIIAALLFMFAPKKGKGRQKRKRIKLPGTIACIIAAAIAIGGFLMTPPPASSFSLSDIPPFSGEPFVILDDNKPSFTDNELTTEAYEHYSELDILGRCGKVEACCGKELMPAKDEDRESISSVTPSGWIQAKYDFVDGTYLYNRCHLIGWQLTAENANENNLISGTRYLNIEGMLPFENMVADYIKETGNHVMYRVTPIYNKNDLLPSGVHMEGFSVEDNGEGICFNVYCYNVQPGITIDYATGRSCVSGDTLPPVSNETDPPADEEYTGLYILNISSKKIHRADCSNVESISAENKTEFTGDLDSLGYAGYTCCGICLKGVELPEATVPESSETEPETTVEDQTTTSTVYILNTDSKKIHYPDCYHAEKTSPDKREEFTGEISELLENGYTKCGTCFS